LGATFDGRDLFSPAAARIAAGESTLGQLGDPIDTASLAGHPAPSPVRDEAGGLRCEVLWVDRFGNAQLDARPADFAHLGSHLSVTLGVESAPMRVRVVMAFAELGEGELGLVIDSYGLVALAFDGSPAAQRLGVAEGDPVYLGTAVDE
jgi:hypothetical protein